MTDSLFCNKTPCGKVPKIHLLGKGINRAYDFQSWDELIDSICTKHFTNSERSIIKNAPYPLQPVILTEDHLDTQIKKISPDLSALRAALDEEKTLRKYASLPFDAILTANYTYELEKALDPTFQCMPGRKCSTRQIAYSKNGKYETEQLHTYYALGNNIPPIWHIHGEAARHRTMILGHYYYGKLLSKMQQYISPFIARYKGLTARGLDMDMHSWLDYFLIGDVYIVGLGMSLSESDLWWLVNCKKRNFPNRKVVLYKPDIKDEERLLAKAYGVVVQDEFFNGDYKEYYNILCEQLKNIVTSESPNE